MRRRRRLLRYSKENDVHNNNDDDDDDTGSRACRERALRRVSPIEHGRHRYILTFFSGRQRWVSSPRVGYTGQDVVVCATHAARRLCHHVAVRYDWTTRGGDTIDNDKSIIYRRRRTDIEKINRRAPPPRSKTLFFRSNRHTPLSIPLKIIISTHLIRFLRLSSA